MRRFFRPDPRTRLIPFPVLWLTLCLLATGVWAQQAPRTPPPAAQPAGQTVPGVSAPQEAPQAPAPAPAPTTAAVGLKIGPGDMLDISVYDVPELAQKVRVTAAGDAYLALIGYVHLDGLTADQAQALIEKKLVDGGYLRNPHVTVFVADYTNQGVSLTGEVSHPGIYPITGARRLLDLIAAAGGLTSRAGRVVYITHRDHPKETASVAMSPDGSQNVEILPGDTVVVSKAGVVYVVGDVGRPSGFIMDNNESLTVLQAIALAGGTNHTAKLSQSKIIRKTPAGPQEIPIPLDKILSAKTKDVPLQNDDVLFVPSSAAKSVAAHSLQTILSIATGVALRPF